MDKEQISKNKDFFKPLGSNKYLLNSNKELIFSTDTTGIQHNRKILEPWLSALFQSEHLSLLLGSGFTTGICSIAGVVSMGMESPKEEDFNEIDVTDKNAIFDAAPKQAKELGRGTANIEDFIRVLDQLICAYEVLGTTDKKQQLEDIREKLLGNLYKGVSETEKVFAKRIDDRKDEDPDPLAYLVSFLLSFASRTATRDRLNIFTTNYDRFIEYGIDLAGLYVLDRFVGFLEPVFRSSKIDLDMHYNPPGIRGEPRYLEGVVRLTKLHGSLDWIFKNNYVCRTRLPFGEEPNNSSVVIYPTAQKDKETAFYPYVDLFRDYAAAVCRPNSVLVTYGYGFGDSHINRVISDMLTIPSTHLLILSFNDAEGRIEKFGRECLRKEQLTVLIGEDLASIKNLVDNYLPKAAIDKISLRESEIFRSRSVSYEQNDNKTSEILENFVDSNDFNGIIK